MIKKDLRKCIEILIVKFYMKLHIHTYIHIYSMYDICIFAIYINSWCVYVNNKLSLNDNTFKDIHITNNKLIERNSIYITVISFQGYYFIFVYYFSSSYIFNSICSFYFTHKLIFFLLFSLILITFVYYYLLW